FSSRRRHTRSLRDWSSDVCSSDLVDESSGRQARHAPVDICPLVRKRRGVQNAVGEHNAAVDDTRKRLARNRYALLHHEWFGERDADRLLPPCGIYLPPEHDSRSTIGIIRLEHEAFAL